MNNPSFKPSLGLLDATMMVAGSMIGSGIFIVSADITRNVGSAGWLMIVWLIGGIMTMIAAMSYGELSAMYPKAGGQYVYLREAYNPFVGFLFGWSFFTVIQTATIAAVAVAFSKFTATLFPFFGEDRIALKISDFIISRSQALAILLIIFLTYMNTYGVKRGKFIQTSFTLTKLLCLFGLILAGLLVSDADIWGHSWHDAWTIKNISADGITESYSSSAALGAFAAAMVGSIFSMDSWNNITFIASEIKRPQRNVSLSLFAGTLIVTLIYVAANLMYISVLTLEDIAGAKNDRVAVAASNAIFNNEGTLIIAIMIMISTFGCNNGLILAGARVYYTMSKDGIFFSKAGTLNNKSVPGFALWLQCIIACAWCVSGRYGDLLDMISFTVVCFYVLTIIGIFILRKKHPGMHRPYKAFGYPYLPGLYIIMGITFCVLLIIFKPQFTWPGVIITMIGVPVYYLKKAKN
jgi:APA family basic amino acid/polyamine antiporter